jgi:hypothetical protein
MSVRKHRLGQVIHAAVRRRGRLLFFVLCCVVYRGTRVRQAHRLNNLLYGNKPATHAQTAPREPASQRPGTISLPVAQCVDLLKRMSAE